VNERVRALFVLAIPVLAVLGVIAGMRYGAKRGTTFANVYLAPHASESKAHGLWIETLADEQSEVTKLALADLDVTVRQCGKETQHSASTDALGAALVQVPYVCDALSVTVRHQGHPLLSGDLPPEAPQRKGEELQLELSSNRKSGSLMMHAYLPTVRAPVDALAPLFVRVTKAGTPVDGVQVQIEEDPALGEEHAAGPVHYALTCKNGLARLAVHPRFAIAPLLLKATFKDEQGEWFGALRTEAGAVALVSSEGHLSVRRPSHNGVTSVLTVNSEGQSVTSEYTQNETFALEGSALNADAFLYGLTLPPFYLATAQSRVREAAWVRWPLRAAYTCESAEALLALPAHAPVPVSRTLKGHDSDRHEGQARKRRGFMIAFASLACGAFAEIALLALGARRSKRLSQGLHASAREDRTLELFVLFAIALLLFSLLAAFLTIRVAV
jgi:hypothetical protein